MPPLRKPRLTADRSGSPAERFSDTFARRPATPRRGLVPGLRVWGTIGGAAALTTLTVLAVPLIGRVNLFPDEKPTVAAAVAAGRPTATAGASASPSPSGPPSHKPADKPAKNSTGGGGGSGGGGVGTVASGGGAGSRTGGSRTENGGGSGSGSGSGATKPASTKKPSGAGSSSSHAGSGGTTAVPGNTLIGTESGRCVDVPGATDGVGKDGTKLDIRDCTGAANQKWEFTSDGTVRSLGLCLDLAWGNTADGSDIQIAKCSGNRAQLFYLSSAGDLVSALADKCVDAAAHGTANGTKLQLWTCNGAANQKWRKG